MNKVSLFLPMLSLVLVLALVILGYVYINKKKRTLENKSGITEFGRHYITPKNFITVVKIGDKFFSLGVTDHNINTISELTEEEIEKYFVQNPNFEIVENFSEILKKSKLLNKFKTGNMRDEKNEKGE